MSQVYLVTLLRRFKLHILMIPIDLHPSIIPPLSPLKYCLKLAALMFRPVASQVRAQLVVPLKCDWRYISMAHDYLAQVVDAVVCVSVRVPVTNCWW